jgi:hypothetical protein
MIIAAIWREALGLSNFKTKRHIVELPVVYILLAKFIKRVPNGRGLSVLPHIPSLKLLEWFPFNSYMEGPH